MKRNFAVATIILLAVAIFSSMIIYMAVNDVVVLHPKGEIGRHQKDLIIISSLLMFIVVLPALLLTLGIAWKYRASNSKAKYTPNWGHSTLAEVIWWGVPLIIIIALSIITYRSTHQLNPFKPLKSKEKPVEIQVVALQWKWLFIYKDEGIATVNYIQIPKNRPINFEITADSPMNGFWIPQLGGQIYAMPSMRTELHLIANDEGEYRGCSSHISGKGFAGMVFTTKASSSEAYEAWVEEVKHSDSQLDMNEYEKLSKPTEYEPAKFYSLKDSQLFDQIINKYSPQN